MRRTDLVKTEQHERPQIDQRKQAKGIGEGEEGREGHVWCVGGLVGFGSRYMVHTPTKVGKTTGVAGLSK
ncbi:hypothetical protein GCM10022269_06250 [Sphingorhabdus rigui]